jgi:hypothetical protein
VAEKIAVVGLGNLSEDILYSVSGRNCRIATILRHMGHSQRLKISMLCEFSMRMDPDQGSGLNPFK